MQLTATPRVFTFFDEQGIIRFQYGYGVGSRS